MSITSFFVKVRSSFLYLPSLYGLVALVFAVISIKIDFYITNNDSIYRLIPNIMFTDIDLASTILSTIAASLLTMTTITFSTILVVLTTYLSQFSPRTLQNFITNHGTQRVLGVFVGGFVYSIVLLLFLEDNGPGTRFIVPFFAILFSVICLFVFVFFIHHVTSNIQVSNLIHNITQTTTEQINHALSRKDEVHEDAPWEDWESEEIKHISPQQIQSKQSGYIQYIDIKELVNQASLDDCIIRVEVKINSYVDESTPLLSVWGMKNQKDVDYLRFITIGTKQAPFHNIEFGMTKIVEIALRALSPAINDPNTAINCIDNLGILLTKLGKMHLPKSYHNDKNRNLRVIIEHPDFSIYLYLCFSQIRLYGFQDISVLLSAIRALTRIAESNSKEIKESVWNFTEYIIEGIDQESLLSLDKQYIDQELKKLAAVSGHGKEFIK